MVAWDVLSAPSRSMPDTLARWSARQHSGQLSQQLLTQDTAQKQVPSNWSPVSEASSQSLDAMQEHSLPPQVDAVPRGAGELHGSCSDAPSMESANQEYVFPFTDTRVNVESLGAPGAGGSDGGEAQRGSATLPPKTVRWDPSIDHQFEKQTCGPSETKSIPPQRSRKPHSRSDTRAAQPNQATRTAVAGTPAAAGAYPQRWSGGAVAGVFFLSSVVFISVAMAIIPVTTATGDLSCEDAYLGFSCSRRLLESDPSFLHALFRGHWTVESDGSWGHFEPLLERLRASQSVSGPSITVSGIPDPSTCTDSRCQGRPCAGTAPQDCSHAQPVEPVPGASGAAKLRRTRTPVRHTTHQ